MSTDYGEKERQFLETLEADTGRGLDAWMAAIAAEGLSERNDIIDWLRRQGFMFSKASWIERIHNNGGRPIYAGVGSPRTRARPRNHPSRPPAAAIAAPAPEPAPPLSASSLPAITISAVPENDRAAREALLARAKAFRPLAAFVIAEIAKAVPGAIARSADGYLTFHRGEPAFALLTISPKELRLGLALQRQPAGIALDEARFPGLRDAAPMTRMIVLTDARQITPALMATVAEAAHGQA